MSGHIVTHKNPLRRRTPVFMLQAVIEGGSEQNPDVEQLWTTRLSDTEFELTCLPFFVYGLALGDVVTASAASGWRITEVVRASGNGLVRAAVTDPADEQDFHDLVHQSLEELDVPHEWHTPRYVSAHIESGHSPDDVLTRIAALGDRAQVERINC